MEKQPKPAEMFHKQEIPMKILVNNTSDNPSGNTPEEKADVDAKVNIKLVESPILAKEFIKLVVTKTGIKLEAEGVMELVGSPDVAEKFVKLEVDTKTDIMPEAEGVMELVGTANIPEEFVKLDVVTKPDIKLEAEGAMEPVESPNITEQFVKPQINTKADIKLEAEDVAEPVGSSNFADEFVKSEVDTKVNIKLEPEDIVNLPILPIVAEEFIKLEIDTETNIKLELESPIISEEFIKPIATVTSSSSYTQQVEVYNCDKCKFQAATSKELEQHKLVVCEKRFYVCKICGYDKAALADELQSHKLLHLNESLFECDQCGYETARKSRFTNHMKNHEFQKRDTFECSFCKFICSNFRKLQRHMRVHGDNVKFNKCKECSYKTERQHYVIVHTQEECVKCDTCDYQTSCKRALEKHSMIHAETQAVAADEGFLQSNSSAPSNIQTKLAEAKVYNCDLCPVQTETNKELKTHKYLHHRKRKSKKKGYGCEICGFKLIFSGSQLQKHKLTHLNETLLKCDWCDYVSSDAFRLKQHINNIHIFKRPKTFKCQFCEFTCSELRVLECHELEHTYKTTQKQPCCNHQTLFIKNTEAGNADGSAVIDVGFPITDATPSTSSDLQAITNANCDVCKTQATTNKRPETHQYIHCPKRKRKRKSTCNGCKECSFKKKKTEVSKEEERFKCQVCDYRTSCNDTLEKHTMLHTGYKPYKCTECEYSTLWKHCLQEHEVTHA